MSESVDSGRDEHGRTPLMSCARYRRMEELKWLLARGADVNAVSNSGRTALHEATCFGNADMVKALVRAGADLNATDLMGYTPLHTACLESSPSEIIKSLVDAGCDLDRQTTDEKNTALHLLAASDLPAVMKILVSAGADLTLRNFRGKTAADMLSNRDARLHFNALTAERDMDAVVQAKLKECSERPHRSGL